MNNSLLMLVCCFGLIFLNYTVVIGGDTEIWSVFQPVGTPETIFADFTKIGGNTSLNPYSGYVLLSTSGVGCEGYEPLDTFYNCSNGERWNGYMLCYSFTSNCAYLEGDGRFIGDIVAFVEGKGFTNPGELPDYNPEHYYQFVIFVGDSPKYITLGTGDGGVWDNYGGIDVVLQQVAPVPEPSSIFVLLCGLGGVSCIVRAGRSRNTFN